MSVFLVSFKLVVQLSWPCRIPLSRHPYHLHVLLAFYMWIYLRIYNHWAASIKIQHKSRMILTGRALRDWRRRWTRVEEEASGSCSICCARLVGHSVPAVGDLPLPLRAVFPRMCPTKQTYIHHHAHSHAAQQQAWDSCTPPNESTPGEREGACQVDQLSSPSTLTCPTNEAIGGGFSTVQPFPPDNLSLLPWPRRCGPAGLLACVTS